MNPKIQKFRDERSKNKQKIASLKERNHDLDGIITKLENSEIIGIVRERKLTPEELHAMLAHMAGEAPYPEFEDRSEENDKEVEDDVE